MTIFKKEKKLFSIIDPYKQNHMWEENKPIIWQKEGENRQMHT